MLYWKDDSIEFQSIDTGVRPQKETSLLRQTCPSSGFTLSSDASVAKITDACGVPDKLPWHRTGRVCQKGTRARMQGSDYERKGLSQ